MAIKLRVTFYALQSGTEINHVNQTTFLNNLDNALDKMQAFAEQYHSEAADVTLLINERHDSIGIWLVGAQSNIDPDIYFVFVLTNLQ